MPTPKHKTFVIGIEINMLMAQLTMPITIPSVMTMAWISPLLAPMARITVRFRSDIAAVTRDSSGAVVAGSLDDAIEAIDVWTFARNAGSADPDWLLVETDEG